MSIRSVVIVGSGHAGFQTAASLRQEGFDGAVALVHNERGLPYQRPPLSKAYLLGKVGPEHLFFRPEKFFVDHRIQLVQGTAQAIDRANQRLVLRNGCTLSYDHLVLAVGAHNRCLSVRGAELRGVLGLRTLADADALRTRLSTSRDVVIVGAGFIGLEFAVVARALGATVHVLELAGRAMARAVSVEMSETFAKAHRDRGSSLHFGQGLDRIKGFLGRVRAVETTAGRRLPADLVVYGVGILPNVQLATDAGLDVEDGISVDAFLSTSDPRISAIGDCASFPDVHTSRRVRLESVQNATDHARAVAVRLVGKPAPYKAVPWFWTEQGCLKLQMAGLAIGHDREILIGNRDHRSFSVLCFRRDQLVAVESLNKPTDHMVARRQLAKATLLPGEAEVAGFDLRAWESRNR